MPTYPYVINVLSTLVCLGVWLSSLVGGQEVCPERWWEEPQEHCTRNLVHFISKDNAHMNPNERINETCRLWQETRECFRRLIALCPESAPDIRQRMMFHSSASQPCYSDRMRHRELMIDCYSHYVGPTQKCRHAFDVTYFDYVLKKDYWGGCRVLASVIKCLHSHKIQIHHECTEDSASEYENNYIRPILDQVSHQVKRRCHMPPPHDQYIGAAISNHMTSCSCWVMWVTAIWCCVMYWKGWMP